MRLVCISSLLYVLLNEIDITGTHVPRQQIRSHNHFNGNHVLPPTRQSITTPPQNNPSRWPHIHNLLVPSRPQRHLHQSPPKIPSQQPRTRPPNAILGSPT